MALCMTLNEAVEEQELVSMRRQPRRILGDSEVLAIAGLIYTAEVLMISLVTNNFTAASNDYCFGLRCPFTFVD